MKNHQSKKQISDGVYYSQLRTWPSLFNIRYGSKVLDIGCGNGLLGGYMQNKHGCQVTGIEIIEECSIRASSVLYKSYHGDIETMDLTILGSDFDYIILSDSLEHLLDTSAVLNRVKGLLAKGGQILIAIPNTRNFRVTLPLLFLDGWNYQDDGFLDRTHLRFFTETSICKLIECCGYKIEIVLTNLPISSKIGKINRLTFGLFRRHLTSHYFIQACSKEY